MDNRHTTGGTGATSGSSGSSAGSDKLRGAMDEAKRSADQVASEVKEAASELAGQARAAAAEAADRTRHKVTDYAEQQKGVAAEQIVKLSEAAHAAADHLNEASPTMARYAHDLAGGIDRFAGVVRERSVGDLMRQASGYARREPAMFVAGTVFVGFMVARFLKSSAERAEREQWQRRDLSSPGDRPGFGRDQNRNAATGPGTMPGQAGSGRSYDPSRRYDERDVPTGGARSGSGRPGGTRTGSGLASGSSVGAAASTGSGSSFASPTAGQAGATGPNQNAGGTHGR